MDEIQTVQATPRRTSNFKALVQQRLDLVQQEIALGIHKAQPKYSRPKKRPKHKSKKPTRAQQNKINKRKREKFAAAHPEKAETPRVLPRRGCITGPVMQPLRGR